MTATVLTLWRPWHQRLIDDALEWLARPPAARADGLALNEMDPRLLRDVGLDPGRIAALNPDAWSRGEIARLRGLAMLNRV